MIKECFPKINLTLDLDVKNFIFNDNGYKT